jgi:hypothetical protein
LGGAHALECRRPSSHLLQGSFPVYQSLRDLSHDPELSRALGNMIVTWAHAETILIHALARVSGMTANMAQTGYYRLPTFEARTNFILALINEWDGAGFPKNDIVTEIQKLGKLAGTRNGWVHGDWCVSKDKKETVIFRPQS